MGMGLLSAFSRVSQTHLALGVCLRWVQDACPTLNCLPLRSRLLILGYGAVLSQMGDPIKPQLRVFLSFSVKCPTQPREDQRFQADTL